MSKDETKNGGPAFPVPEQRGQQYAPHPHGMQWEQQWEPAKIGMSIREYFAAHAPEQIPDWFIYKPAINWDNITEDEKTSLESWICDPCWDLPENLASFWRETNREWSKTNNLNRYFQWRYYYADKMIEYSKLQKE